jgi:hypothetical protein
MKLKGIIFTLSVFALSMFGGTSSVFASSIIDSVRCWPPGSKKIVKKIEYTCMCITVNNVYHCFWVSDATPDEDQRATKRQYYFNSTYGPVGLHMEAVDAEIDRFSISTSIYTASGLEDLEPAGSLRVQMLIQKLVNGSWTTQWNSGYVYNSTSTAFMHYVYDMEIVPDWGDGQYRLYGLSQKYDGGTWLGTSGYTTSVYMNSF